MVDPSIAMWVRRGPVLDASRVQRYTTFDAVDPVERRASGVVTAGQGSQIAAQSQPESPLLQVWS